MFVFQSHKTLHVEDATRTQHIILVPDFWTGSDYDFCNNSGSGSDLDVATIFLWLLELQNDE